MDSNSWSFLVPLSPLLSCVWSQSWTCGCWSVGWFQSGLGLSSLRLMWGGIRRANWSCWTFFSFLWTSPVPPKALRLWWAVLDLIMEQTSSSANILQSVAEKETLANICAANICTLAPAKALFGFQRTVYICIVQTLVLVEQKKLIDKKNAFFSVIVVVN